MAAAASRWSRIWSALAMRAEEEAKRARDQLTVAQTDIVAAVDAVTKVDGALVTFSTDIGQVHDLLATIVPRNLAHEVSGRAEQARRSGMDPSASRRPKVIAGPARARTSAPAPSTARPQAVMAR